MERAPSVSRDLLRALLVGLGAFLAVGLVETTQIAVSITQAGKPTAWWEVGSYNLIYWSLAGLLTPLVAWLAALLPLTGARRWRHLAAHVVLVGAFGLLHIALYSGGRVLAGQFPGEKLGASQRNHRHPRLVPTDHEPGELLEVGRCLQVVAQAKAGLGDPELRGKPECALRGLLH